MSESQKTITRIPAASERARLKDGVHIELSPRRVRAYFDNQVLVDSEKVLLVFETRRPPVYWFPIEDVRMDLLELREASAGSGTRRYHSKRGGRIEENLAWDYPEAAGDLAPLAGHIAFYWNAVDRWFEEDEEVYVHPRDPYTRVDTVHSSRHVRVEVDGEVIAETARPVLLYETGLPTRYYIPKLDVRMDLLEATHTVTHCPSGQTRWGGGSTGPAEPGREHPDTVVLRRHSRCGLSHPPVPGGRGTDVRGFQRHGRRHAQ